MRTELSAVFKKELRQAFRDRRMAFVLMMAPVVQLTLLGFAVDLDVDRIPTAVVDHDGTAESRELARGLLAEGTFERVGDFDEPDAAIMNGDAQVALVIPRGFAHQLQSGGSSQVQVIVDGSDPIVAQVASNASELYLRKRSADVLRARVADRAPTVAVYAPGIEPRPRLFYNPRLKSTQYMIPGVAAVVLLIVTTVVTAMGIARERELGTIEQLLVTPMRPATLLLGKTLPFAMIGLVVAGLVIAVGTHLFSVPIHGSILVLIVGIAFYVMSTLGTGVFISTIAKNQQQAILGGFFFLMPAILLSGFMSPIENMPAWIRAITWVNPVRHFVKLLRAVLLKGAGFQDLWLELLLLFTFGATILTIASLRFRKRLA